MKKCLAIVIDYPPNGHFDIGEAVNKRSQVQSPVTAVAEL
jgi:hypothetical protein